MFFFTTVILFSSTCICTPHATALPIEIHNLIFIHQIILLRINISKILSTFPLPPPFFSFLIPLHIHFLKNKPKLLTAIFLISLNHINFFYFFIYFNTLRIWDYSKDNFVHVEGEWGRWIGGWVAFLLALTICMLSVVLFITFCIFIIIVSIVSTVSNVLLILCLLFSSRRSISLNSLFSFLLLLFSFYLLFFALFSFPCVGWVVFLFYRIFFIFLY